MNWRRVTMSRVDVQDVVLWTPVKRCCPRFMVQDWYILPVNIYKLIVDCHWCDMPIRVQSPLSLIRKRFMRISTGPGSTICSRPISFRGRSNFVYFRIEFVCMTNSASWILMNPVHVLFWLMVCKPVTKGRSKHKSSSICLKMYMPSNYPVRNCI